TVFQTCALPIWLLSSFFRLLNAKGDPLLYNINVEHLHVHFLAFFQHLMRRADPAMSDLGDVHQTFYARGYFNERAEVDQTTNSTLNNFANLELISRLFPRSRLSSLHAEGNPLVSWVELQNFNLNQVAFFYYIGRLLN